MVSSSLNASTTRQHHTLVQQVGTSVSDVRLDRNDLPREHFLLSIVLDFDPVSQWHVLKIDVT